jgi:hypothetical protein
LLNPAIIVTCLLFTVVIAQLRNRRNAPRIQSRIRKVDQSKQAADKSKEKPGFALLSKDKSILNISLKARENQTWVENRS